jgi:radical SAM protein
VIDARGSAHGRPSRLDFDRRPILVFWETTRACSLACAHCRAEAQIEPLPGQLTFDESLEFLDTLTQFGRPYPVLVLTGGDVMMRDDLLDVVRAARRRRLPVALAPSVTPLLHGDALSDLRRLGVKVASLSLDGARPATHEGLRGVAGHFEATLDAIALLREHGFTVQVNTAVTRDNVQELPDVAAIVQGAGASVWEVFFLVRTGRGTGLAELDPTTCEDVCQFLYDASHYGFVVRTVEGPFFRRIATWRREGRPAGGGPLYAELASRLRRLLGEPRGESKAQTKGTRDGKGIVFVSHDGDVYPAGFLPIRLGNVRERGLPEIYRDHPLITDIRAARFHGRCGRCEYNDVCGGSRARAYAATGDPLGEDPACAYVPAMAPPTEKTGP